MTRKKTGPLSRKAAAMSEGIVRCSDCGSLPGVHTKCPTTGLDCRQAETGNDRPDAAEVGPRFPDSPRKLVEYARGWLAQDVVCTRPALVTAMADALEDLACDCPACRAHPPEPCMQKAIRRPGAESALKQLVSNWEAAAGALDSEVKRGVAVRQSIESKQSRVEVLRVCARELRGCLPRTKTASPEKPKVPGPPNPPDYACPVHGGFRGSLHKPHCPVCRMAPGDPRHPAAAVATVRARKLLNDMSFWADIQSTEYENCRREDEDLRRLAGALTTAGERERERLTETEHGWTEATILHCMHVYKESQDEGLEGLLRELLRQLEAKQGSG